MRTARDRLVRWVRDSVTLPEDSESVKIRKTVIVIVMMTVIPVNLVWVISLVYLDLPLAVAINLGHAAVLLAAFVYLVRKKNYRIFTHLVMLDNMLYIFSQQINLGGIVRSGLLISGGLLSVMIAAMVLSRRSTLFWAGFNIVGITLMLAFEPQIAAAARPLPASYSVTNGFFYTAWTTLLAVFLVLYMLRDLEIAQDLADSLLYNVLPRPIAARLKRGAGTIAQSYESVSVLFADIVGFTPLSTILSPEGMIELLNEIYSAFDALVEKHGAEKIRTIGDNYMAAAGVPEARSDHAHILADLALDMQAYCRELAPVGKHVIRFRIGINSGPLIAGVIGTARYQYDIYGDTVNTASRMESHGEAGKIQVTDATRQLLGEEYSFEDRGMMDVKGKGEMRTWFLLGRGSP